MQGEIFERFMAKVSPESNSGCWLWKGAISSTGYGHCVVDGRLVKVHRLAYELFKGPIKLLNGSDCRGTCVIHSCDNPICVNPDHLRLGTHRDNMDDKRERNRFVSNPLYGEDHQNAKLKAAEVVVIRRRAAIGDSHCQMAKEYGVTQATVRDAVVRRTWKWL